MGRLALIVMMLLACPVAYAQGRPEGTPEGTRLFDEGRELAKQGRYEEACSKFSQSLEVYRAPGTALNYGDCLEKLGQLRKAWLAFDEAGTLFAKANDSRAAFARERANAVEAQLAVVVVKVAEPDVAELVLQVANESVPPTGEILVRIEPGEIVVTASAPGRQPFRQSARGVAGQRVIVQVPVLAVLGGTSISKPAPPAHMNRDSTRVKLAYIVGGVGGATLLGSLAVGLLARSQYNGAVDDDCVTERGELVCSPGGASEIAAATTKANVATGLAIGGGVLVAAGVVLFVTAPTERAVMPTVSTTSVGVAFSGRF